MPEIPTTIKKKELVEKKREQIILAAIKLFCKKGFHKTTLKHISEEAGVSQGSIYDYIRTKEDIFALLHDYMTTFLMDEISRTAEDVREPSEKLRKVVHTEFNQMRNWSDPILLMYQEAHSLSKPLQKRLLEREKKHVLLFENILRNCIKEGILRDFNTRIAANLLISMMHAYVVRRWDLAKYITVREMERSVLDIFFNGLMMQKGLELERRQDDKSFRGKTILLINGSSAIGKSLSSFLLSKGARLAIHSDDISADIELLSPLKINSENVKFYSIKDYGDLTSHLFDQILSDFGHVSAVIQDFNISDAKTPLPSNILQISQRLESSTKRTEELPILLEKNMTKSGSARILYIAPWTWDKQTNPLSYEVLKAGTVALTKAMAKRLAPSKINVNCIVPGFISGIELSEMKRGKASEVLDLIPLKCMGDFEDVLDAVYYFISDASKYVTGQILEVTGGVS